MASDKRPLLVNENQARALTSTFAHIEDLFAGVERAMLASEDPSTFSPYLADVSPVQRQVIADSLALLRAKMRETLDSLGIRIVSSKTGGLWRIRTNLSFAEIAIEDVSPSRLRGYGSLDSGAAELVERLEADLERDLRNLGIYLAGDAGSDFAGPLKAGAERDAGGTTKAPRRLDEEDS